jgi:hypothetical protein
MRAFTPALVTGEAGARAVLAAADSEQGQLRAGVWQQLREHGGCNSGRVGRSEGRASRISALLLPQSVADTS